MMNLKLILCLIILFFSYNSFAQNPQISDPLDGEICLPKDVLIKWDIVPNANGYRVQITETAGDYTNPVVNVQSVSQNFYQAVVPENNKTYYFRVAAKFTQDFWSQEQSFTTRRKAEKTISPDSAITCQTKKLTLKWEPFPNVTSYRVQVSPISSFGSLTVNNTSVNSTTLSIDLPDNYTNYYWRVAANYTSGSMTCQTDYTNVHPFRTIVAIPVITSPLNNDAGISFNPTLQWNAAIGAIGYDVQVSTSADFAANNLIVDETDLNATDLQITLSSEFNKNYWWRIRSIEETNCKSEWSTGAKFTTKLDATEILAPENDIECVKLFGTEFSWGVVPSSNTFQFQLATNNNFLGEFIKYDVENITTNKIVVDLPDDNTTYHYRVRTKTKNNFGDWTPTRKFQSGIFPAEPISPANQEKDVFIATKLTWESESSFSNLRLQVASNSNFNESELLADSSGIIGYEYFIVLPEYAQTYYWRISSTLGNCESGWTPTNEFTTYKGSPTLTFPANDQINLLTNVTFEWSEVPFATSYDIQLSLVEDFEIVEKTSLDVPTNIILFNDLKPQTKYYWRTRSVNQYSRSPWSEPNAFTTGLDNTNRPTLISPKNNETKVPLNVTFIWSEGLNAQQYELQISKNSNFSDLVLFQNDISNTFFTTTLDENYKTYYFRVRSKNETSISPWSISQQFRTIAPSVTEIATAIKPEGGDKRESPLQVKFEWTAIENTLEYEGGYELQVSLSKEFNPDSSVFSNKKVFRTDPTIYNLAFNSTHYFRIRGWNEANDGEWSEVKSFVTTDGLSVDNKIAQSLELYPNPNKGKFNFNFDLLESGYLNLKIIDLTGKEISNNSLGYYSNGIHNLEIDKINFENGTYLIILESNGKISTYKFNIIK